MVSDSALGARLKDARKAVGDNGDKQAVIKTFHGRGYQFIAEVVTPAEAQATENHPVSSNTAPSEKSSIVVLPFQNRSNDPEQEFFSDGITEDIITALTRFREFSVISRNASFAYKNQEIGIVEIGRQLGVGFAIEGSVRKSGNQVRITVNLIDTASGSQVWGEHYDRRLDDVFSVQDEVVKATVVAVAGHLRHEEIVRIEHQTTGELKANDLILQAGAKIYELSKTPIREGIELLERAIEIEPDDSQAYAWLGCAWLVNYSNRFVAEPDTARELALKYGKQAVKLDEASAAGHYALSETYLYAYKNLEIAREHAERALAFNPGASETMNWLGFLRCVEGRCDEGIPMVEEAYRLDPMAPRYQRATTGMSYYLSGNYPEAISCLRSVELDTHMMMIYLVAAYQAAEQFEAATQTASRVLELGLLEMESIPDNWADHFLQNSGFIQQQDLDRFKTRIIAAGIPDGPYKG